MGPGAEKAEVVTEVCRQQRTRRRFLGDGTAILEEQEVVFTERKTTWPVKDEARDTVQDAAPEVEGTAQNKEEAVHVDVTGASAPVVIAV
jgi:hypothetical protein